MENPASFTFDYAAEYFYLLIMPHIQYLSICIPIENYDQFYYASRAYAWLNRPMY